MAKLRHLVAGNWKMNGSRSMAAALIAELKTQSGSVSAGLLVCPPFPYLIHASEFLMGSNIALGAQDCAPKESGAHTGDVAAAQPHQVQRGGAVVQLRLQRRDPGPGPQGDGPQRAGDGDDLTVLDVADAGTAGRLRLLEQLLGVQLLGGGGQAVEHPAEASGRSVRTGGTTHTGKRTRAGARCSACRGSRRRRPGRTRGRIRARIRPLGACLSGPR